MAKREINSSGELFLGNGNNVSVNTSTIVTAYNTLKVHTIDGKIIPLDIKIQADFDTIPKEYHEIFLNVFTSKYLETASFADNSFSQAKPLPKKRWWNFWKSYLNI